MMTAHQRHSPAIDPAAIIDREVADTALSWLPPDTRQAFAHIDRDAIAALVRTIHGRGMPSEYDLQNRVRNRCFRELAAIGWTAGQIERRLRRYRTGAGWHADRRAQTLPESLAHKPEKWLWLALKCRDQLCKKRHIHNIINDLNVQ